MIEPVSVPIYLDLDISEDGGYELELETQDNVFDMDIGSPIIIREGGGLAVNGLPAGGRRDDILVKKSDSNYDAEWVAPASEVEEDNTRPITSAAVYKEVGNINALLATI